MVIVHVTASATFGGGPEYIRTLVEALPQEGLRHLIAAPRDYPYWDRFTALVGEASLYELPHRAFRLSSLLGLAAFCRANKADIVHSHGKGGGLYGRLCALLTGVRSVHTYHGIHMGKMGAPARALYVALERVLGRVSRACVAVSPGEARQVAELGFCPAQRLHVVRNGVRLPAMSAPPNYPAAPPLRVVHMSRFDGVHKNSAAVLDVALALRELGGLDRFRFVMLGDGPEREPLEAAAAEHGLGDSFQFEGFVDRPAQWLAGAFAYLSTSRWEGMPLAVLEAMALGVPPVVSDVVGNNDAVGHGESGLLYPLDNPAAAAEALLNLLRQDLWEKLSAEALRSVGERHDVRGTAQAQLEVYRSVAG